MRQSFEIVLVRFCILHAFVSTMGLLLRVFRYVRWCQFAPTVL
jgi:hypothetical protein